MSSPLSRRLDKAAAAAGLGPHGPSAALHVVASWADFHRVSALFVSPFARAHIRGTPPPSVVVDPNASVYERMTYWEARAAGIVYETPEAVAHMAATRPRPDPVRHSAC